MEAGHSVASDGIFVLLINAVAGMEIEDKGKLKMPVDVDVRLRPATDRLKATAESYGPWNPGASRLAPLWPLAA